MIFSISDLQISPPANGELFEKLCLDLYKKEFGDKTQGHGRSGQAQAGVDIFEPDQNIGIQCKKRDYNGKIKKAELRQEVKKAKTFKPDLKRFILATTCKRDANIQEEARLISEAHKKENLFSVEVHSWEEIKNLLDKQIEVRQQYYGTTTYYADLERIHSLLNKKPKTALQLLEKFKQTEWGKLNDKGKYTVLTYMADAKHRIKDDKTSFDLAIQALQFNPKDEGALINCAFAHLMKGNLEESKKYLNKTRELNPQKTEAYNLEIQIQHGDGKSIKDIVKSLPEDITNQAQIAQLLAGFSINQKDYKSAKKWVKVFYNQIDKKDYITLSSYADLMLKIITQDPNIYKTKERASHQYQNELKEVISIYKKIFSDSEYSEIREIDANLYVNYAIALEIKEELDKTIEVLKTGEKLFPEDYNLKHSLIQGFLKKKSQKSKIIIQNQKYGLHHNQIFTLSKTEDCNDIVNIINKIPEKKRNVFVWSILADIKFFNEKNPEEGIEILQKASLLKYFNIDDQFIIKEALIDKFMKTNQVEKAEQELTKLDRLDPQNPIIPIIGSKISALKGDTETQKKYLNKALKMVPENNDNQWFLYSLATELYIFKMYAECESLFENLIENNLNHPDIFYLLRIYFENGKNQQAIELAESLFNKFPHRLEPVNYLCLIYDSLGDKEKAIQYCENFLKQNPQNQLIKIELALAYIRNKQTHKAKKLLEKPFDIKNMSVEEISRLSLAYMKTGHIKQALETQYQCMKKYPREMEPQAKYFQLCHSLNYPEISNFEQKSQLKKDRNLSFLYPQKADRDCFILLEEINTQEPLSVIIEKDSDHPPDHELSKKLLGKQVGDKIIYVHKTYQIKEIKSKYLYKFQKIAEEAERKFGSKSFLKLAYVPKKDELDKPDIEKLTKVLKNTLPDRQKQQNLLDALFQFYKKGQTPIGFMAKVLGEHPIDVMNVLMASQKDKFISSVPKWNANNKIWERVTSQAGILMDISSLMMIFRIKMEKVLEKSDFKFYICPSTLDSLRKFGEHIAIHTKDGLLQLGFDQKGDLVKNLTPAESMQQSLNFYLQLIKWTEKHCQIKTIPSHFVFSRQKKLKWEKTFGKEFLDPILTVYSEKDLILLSEDAILRELARGLHQKIDQIQSEPSPVPLVSCGLLDLIDHWTEQAILDESQMVRFKAGLVTFNQSYIPIDHKILLFLLKELDYSFTHFCFQRALFFLGPVSDLQGVINVGANFLIELCQDSGLLPYRKQMIIHEVLDKVSLDRPAPKKAIAYQIWQVVQMRTKLLPILQNEIGLYIMEWTKSKVY